MNSKKGNQKKSSRSVASRLMAMVLAFAMVFTSSGITSLAEEVGEANTEAAVTAEAQAAEQAAAEQAAAEQAAAEQAAAEQAAAEQAAAEQAAAEQAAAEEAELAAAENAEQAAAEGGEQTAAEQPATGEAAAGQAEAEAQSEGEGTPAADTEAEPEPESEDAAEEAEVRKNTVTFTVEDGATVTVNGVNVTNGTAQAEEGKIVFTITTSEGYEITSVLVDGSIDARKNEETPEDDDYIIEGIQTDETIVSVSTEQVETERTLIDQTISATIYADASYSAPLSDGTSITLSGVMPEGAEAKAYPVNVSIDDVIILAAYDITIFDTEGEEYQPEQGALNVKIENAEIREALADEEELTVYHMETVSDTPEEIATIEPEASIVTFSAMQFSIYIVGENGELKDENGDEVDAYTVYFYEWVYDEAELGEPEIAEEKVVGDDYLNEPEVPEIEHHVFDGWFTEEQDANHYSDGEYPGYKYDFSMTVQQNLDTWDGYEVGEGNVINLYSDYDPIYYVYYMTEEEFDESGEKTNEDVVVYTDEYHENNSILDTSNAETIYQQSHLTAGQAVTSWYYYDENGDKQDIASGAEITDNMTLYPVVQDVIWVYFYLGEEAGENVEAVEPIYVPGDATEFGELPVPEMAGYEFAGWYFQVEDGEDILVEADSNPQDYITAEKKDIDLYANWTPANVGYTVNIWRQKATDGQAGIDQKTVEADEKYSTYINYYDYAESFTVSSEQSQIKTGDTPTTGTVYNWSTYTGYGWTTGNRGSDGTGDYVGFEYNQTRTENDLATVTVKADGSTIINIFYDRVTVTYNFGTSSNSTRYGTLIGLYDTNTAPTNGSEPGGTLNGWPDPDSGYSWHYSVSGSASGNNMSFLAKFALTENSSNRSNQVNFTQSNTGYSATLYYYLEVTNPDKQVTDDSKTIIIDDITYVLDRTVTFGISSRTGNTFNFTDKYIGYEYVGYNTNGGTTMQTPSSKSATVSSGGSLYIFNNALKYTIDLYSNHNGEQLVWSDTYKYGAPLSSVEFPDELDAKEYGPAYYYHFTGSWYEDPTFTAEFVKPDTMPNYNLVAYADWELNEVTVTFQSYVESDLYDQLAGSYGAENVTTISTGGEGSDDPWAYSIVIKAGDELDYTLDIGFEAAEVAGHNYEYGGLLNVDTNKVFNFASQIYSDTTLQLFWIEEQTVYHLQYNLNQGEGGTVTEVLGHGHESTSWAEVRELVDVFEDVDDTDFICWNTEPDGSGTDFYPDDDVDFTQVVAEPVYDEETGEILYYVYNLYAIWAEEKTATLDLEYNYPAGYETSVTNEIITGSNLENIELSDHNPSVTTITINGEDGSVKVYAFSGWAYTDDTKNVAITTEDTVAVDSLGDDNVLYAVWESISLSVEKTANVEEGYEAKLGDSISYTITVTNDGDVTLENITVTDDLTGESWTIDSLAPEASETFTTTYVVTEGDILNGSVANVATATAPNPNYDPDDPDSPEDIEGKGEEEVTTEDKDPHLTVTKEATSKPENGETYALGEEITWKVTVTNDGNLTITDIVVTDELTGDTWTIESLAPGEDVTFETEPYTVTEADIIKGYVANEATATGTSPDPENPDTPVEPGDDDEPTDEENPHLTVSKVVNSTPANGTAYDLGEEIIWKITVTNDGNLTISDIVVTDELTGDTWTVEGTLAPGESKTFEASHVVNEADIEAGDVYNEATATGTSPDPENPDVPVIPGDDDEPTVTPGPSLYVEKTADVKEGEEAVLGQEITYTIKVTNNGNVTLTNITVTDDLTGDTWAIESLAPNEEDVHEVTYVVTEKDILAGSVANVATATAPNPDWDPEDPDSPKNIEGEDSEVVKTEDPVIDWTAEKTLENSGSGEDGAFKVGETAEFKITVTNTGNVTVEQLDVTEVLEGATFKESEDGSYTLNEDKTVATVTDLAVGATVEIYAEYEIQEKDLGTELTNSVTTEGGDPEEPTPGPTPEVPVPTEDPVIDWTAEKTLENSGSGEDGAFKVGETAEFTITVTNTGNVTIEQLDVTEVLEGATFKESEDDSYTLNEDKTVATVTDLAVGATVEIYAEYEIQEKDLGTELTNSVTTEGGDPEDPQPGPTPEVPVPTEDPVIDWTAEKTLENSGSGEDGAFKVGETAEFTITVTNTGNVTIEQLDVTEVLEGATFKESEDGSYTLNEDKTVATVTDLAVGATVEIYAEYEIQEKDLGTELTNSVTTEGGDPEEPTPGPTPEVPVPTEDPVIDWTAEKTLENSGSGEDGAFKVGETAEFTITVTNTGNVTIEQLDVTEVLEGATFKESEDGSYTLNEDKTVATVTDLAVGAIVEIYAEYEIQEKDLGTELTNSVTTVGGDPEDPQPGPTPEEPIPTEKIDWTVEKELTNEGSAAGGAFKAGETAEFTITVTNTGNVTVEQIEITEVLKGATFVESKDDSYTLNEDKTVATVTDLAVEASVEIYAEYTVQEEDLGTDLKNSIETAGGDPDDPKPGPGDEEPIPTEEYYFPLDEEIVPGADDEADPDSWVKDESVNEYEPIEIEMSTTLPKVSGTNLTEKSYEMTFHNKFSSDALVLDDLDTDFLVDINGRPIDHKYYVIDTVQAERAIQPYSVSDGCTFHVNVDLSALYTDGVITDDDLGTATIRVFFYVDLEATDVVPEYTSTAWYDVTADGEVVYTSDPSTVTVYTFEIIIDKYDAETGEPLSGATFGLYYDYYGEDPVAIHGEEAVSTSDESGQAAFIGIAEGAYYVKEIEAPEGYEKISAPIGMNLSISDESNHVLEFSLGNTPGESPETNEGGPTVTKKAVSTPKNGTAYVEGETIDYEITVKNETDVTISDIQVKDALTGLDEIIDILEPGEEKILETSYTVTKRDAEAGSILNVAIASGVTEDGDPVTGEGGYVAPTEPEESEPESEKDKDPVAPTKTVDVGDKEVAVGEELTYTIMYFNHHAYEDVITIVDTLEKGLEYVDGSATDNGNYDEENRTITWTIPAEEFEAGSVSFKAKVSSEAESGGKIANTATVQVGSENPESTNTVENTLASGSGSGTGSGSGSGSSGTGSGSGSTSSVKTADETPVGPVTGMLALALFVLLGSAGYTFRRRRSSGK